MPRSEGVGRSNDPGSVSAFVTCLAASFVVIAGLAVDSGRMVAARIEVADHAENAARIGAQQVTGIRSGERVIDAPRARAAALLYLQRFEVEGDVRVESESVTVTARTIEKMTLLRLVGVTERSLSATRRAELRDR